METPMETEKKALALLGLAARAGRVTVGLPLTCEALKNARNEKRPQLVLLASDASANTVKRITDRTNYYKVSLCRLQAAGHTLALAVGKRATDVAVVGVTEPHLAAAVRELLTAEKQI
ncbi:MAG: ribosomal L7Ae/L30e/S12e/Gadd45 family protein [Clostridia bacterium]|nr:ribosomal L7Ae/L30e/S12e/Gadd45 family protein [Clostridia bacterium]